MHMLNACRSSRYLPLKQMLACHLYISEGRDRDLLATLEAVARSTPGVALVNVFVDEPYHRSNFTFATGSRDSLAKAVTTTALAALPRLDLRHHDATHPRLGVVDHISCHPLSPDTDLDDAAALARNIGSQLGASLPVYLYGRAHHTRRGLAEVRRALGYFKPSAAGTRWAGPAAAGQEPLQPPPDYGPLAADPAAGVTAIGAVPWIVNYNVPIATKDIAAGAEVARQVSERGGGLPSVQAMALRHGEGTIEVACNLLDHDVSSPEQVQQLTEQLCGTRGLRAGQGYVMGGKLREQVLLDARRMLLDRIDGAAHGCS